MRRGQYILFAYGNRLSEALRSLQLIHDTLHVRLVRNIAVEERWPLVGGDPETSLRGYLNNLRVVLSPQTVVRPKLIL